MVSLNHATLGEAFEINGRYEQAAASFDKAIETPPKNEYAMRVLVLFLLRQNEYPRAIVAGLNALTQDAYSAEIYYAIARSYRRLGEMNEYEYWSDRILQSGNMEIASMMGATIALENGLIEKAIQQYEDALQVWREWEAIYSLARAYTRNHQTDALLELIESYAPAILNFANSEDWPPQMAMLIAPAAWALLETGEQDRAPSLQSSSNHMLRQY